MAKTNKTHFLSEKQKESRVCSNCGRRYGEHYGIHCPDDKVNAVNVVRSTFVDSGNIREASITVSNHQREEDSNYDYSTICAICGKERGHHYSRGTLVFCSYDSLKCYNETGVVTGSIFTAGKPKKAPLKTYKHKPEMTKNAKVIMAITDRWAKRGMVGVIKFRECDSAQVNWNNGNMYFHDVDSLSLVKDSKDPNILFLTRKDR